PRQAPARLRLPSADGLLPAAGRRGADGRADRDRDQGEPRRLRRRDRGDPRRGRGRPGDRQERPVFDPGAAPRRGPRDPQAGGTTALGRAPGPPATVEAASNDATSPADADAESRRRGGPRPRLAGLWLGLGWRLAELRPAPPDGWPSCGRPA